MTTIQDLAKTPRVARLAAAFVGMTPEMRLAKACKRGSAVIVGDIFDAAWGNEQTNIDFYQVVKVTPKMIALRKIDKRTDRQQSDMVRTVLPIANKFDGPVIRKKLDNYNGRAMVRLNSYSFAYKWDGKPKTETSYG